MRPLLSKTFLLAYVAVIWSCPALASDTCTNCGAEPNLSDAEVFLASQGYPSTDYTVLFSWSEQLSDGSGKYVTGFHVNPIRGSVPFDLYSDDAGNLLSSEQVARLGIVMKRWDLPPAETVGYIPETVTKDLPPPPTPLGPSNGLIPLETVLLPRIDQQKALQEDADRMASGRKGGRRIAVFQDFDRAIQVDGYTATRGAWQRALHGGRLWSVSIVAPGALGMRVHFAELSLPAGAQLIVYNENDPMEALGPYSQPAKNMLDLWSATCFSDSVIVECYVPAGIEIGAVHIKIDKITHQYVPFAYLPWAEAAWSKSAGTCNNDVSCYPAWATAATGIAGYDGIGPDGGFFCSGAVLADTSNSATPYFLTANHCVSSASTASTLEFFWFYQTSTCNGTPPSRSSVPTTTGGAALLANTDVTSGADFCLLRLNTTPPAGVSYLGWSSSAIALGTSTVCIHHPSADYKRITFGALTSTNPGEPANRFYQSTWSSGVTEPGSSGSPLMTASNGQVIGQLYGGPSFCGASSADLLDYYGRFDQSYPIVQSYLNPMGSLRVTIAPTAAISAGARWRVDSGAWQASGTTLNALSVGQHTVEFSTVAGWDTPVAQVATITNGALTALTGTYVMNGSLLVTLHPAEAVTAGARWRVDNGSWRASGVTVDGLSAGQHTVDFKAVSGWTAPASRTATISGGQTTLASGTYTIIQPTGSVQVSISPVDAVNVGGQWRVDGSAWQASGVTVAGLSIGQHTVNFKPIVGWTTPIDQTVTISDSQTTLASGAYTLVSAAGSLHVTIGPADAVNSGAQWRVDGGAWQPHDATVNGLAAGQHTLEFAPLPAWVAPASQALPINDNQTTEAAGTYTLFADVNSDGSITASDIQLVIDAALGIEPIVPDADINGDGATNAVDVQLVINAALGLF